MLKLKEDKRRLRQEQSNREIARSVLLQSCRQRDIKIYNSQKVGICGLSVAIWVLWSKWKLYIECGPWCLPISGAFGGI